MSSSISLQTANVTRTAGEMTRPVASVPVELAAQSSLAAAMSAFHGHMVRQGFSDNTVKALPG